MNRNARVNGRIDRSRHPGCYVCGGTAESGMNVCFTGRADGSISGTFACAPMFQGFPDRIHGGIIAMLLDEAMTQCLWLHGIIGVTGRLDVSFIEPVVLGEQATIRARILDESETICMTDGELEQGGRVKAHARGKFAPMPD